MTYALGWVTETEGERDKDGNVISGSEKPVFVLMDLPPGLDEAGKRNRDTIKRACKKAVFELGLEEYGNKNFVVVCYDEPFTVECERVTITKLMSPDKAEQVREANGKDVLLEDGDDVPFNEDEDEDNEDEDNEYEDNES